MHGTEHRNRTHGAPRFLTPRLVFSPPAGSMPQSTPPAASDQDRLLVTAFRSPVTVAPSRSPHPGVKVPGLLLRSLPPVHTARSDLPLRLRSRFAPVKRRFRCVDPVAAPPCGSPDCSCGLHSPPGLLPPSGSKRSTASAASRSAFRIRPISSRSPQPVSISRTSTADHRSWFATFPEACCSSNLLEPLFTMPRPAVFVNDFSVTTGPFSTIFIWFVSKWLQPACGASSVDKTQIRNSVLV